MDLEAFRLRFPEFKNVPDVLVNPALDAAALQTSTDFGTSYDEAHGLLTADLLASSPFGKMARLEAEDKATNYAKLRAALEHRVLLGIVVT